MAARSSPLLPQRIAAGGDFLRREERHREFGTQPAERVAAGGKRRPAHRASAHPSFLSRYRRTGIPDKSTDFDPKEYNFRQPYPIPYRLALQPAGRARHAGTRFRTVFHPPAAHSRRRRRNPGTDPSRRLFPGKGLRDVRRQDRHTGNPVRYDARTHRGNDTTCGPPEKGIPPRSATPRAERRARNAFVAHMPPQNCSPPNPGAGRKTGKGRASFGQVIGQEGPAGSKPTGPSDFRTLKLHGYSIPSPP